MKWLTALTLLIKLVLEVVKYFERRQILREAEATQLLALMEKADALVTAAQAARESVSHTHDDILLDPDNRANWPDTDLTDRERGKPDPPDSV